MAYLPPDGLRAPLLCVSDTHLGAEQAPFVDDDPDSLLAMLSRHPKHRIYILGDFVESYSQRTLTAQRLRSSARLAPLFQLLQRRHANVILGNHDKFAREELTALFGSRVCSRSTGMKVGNIRLLHGDSWERKRQLGERFWGNGAARAHAFLQRRGIRVPGEAVNHSVVKQRPSGEYWIFGHTHAAELSEHYANTGSFLERRPRTFITVEFHRIALWEWCEA